MMGVSLLAAAGGWIRDAARAAYIPLQPAAGEPAAAEVRVGRTDYRAVAVH